VCSRLTVPFTEPRQCLAIPRCYAPTELRPRHGWRMTRATDALRCQLISFCTMLSSCQVSNPDARRSITSHVSRYAFLPNLTLRNQKISSAICFDSLVGFNLGLLLFLHSEGTDKQLYRPNEHGVWAKGRGGIWNRPAGPGARLIGDMGGIFTFLNSPQRRHGLPVLQSIPVFVFFCISYSLPYIPSHIFLLLQFY
jgi:hypothetical protein